MKRLYLLIIVCLFVHAASKAQDRQLITYHGQFRTLLSDNRMNGNILRGDSLSPKRGALGTMFLDLGITVTPNEDFRLYAEFRMRNIIGQYNNYNSQNGIPITNNSLIDSRIIFRQVRAEGNIKKIIFYQIGDIDLDLTKYTLYNNYETDYDFESSLSKERRTIAHYENFQTKNMWRLQGVSVKSQINFRGPLKRVDLKFFGTRTKLNSDDGTPDRLLVGGKMDIVQSKILTLGGNWLNIIDIPGTTLTDTLVDYHNQVLTGNYKITVYNKQKFEFNIVGEHGISRNKYFIKVGDTTAHKKDYFIDAGIRAIYKPSRIELTASYINVGYDFTSPGAQSLRIRQNQPPLFFTSLNNSTSIRDLTLFDRFTDETIYNQRIQPGLMPFIPLYGNVLPYGPATPNRTGLIFNVGQMVDTNYVLSFHAGGAVLSEIASEGDYEGKQLRHFLQLKGGVVFNISKLIEYNKTILLSFGGRYENTTRSGSAYIGFNSFLADAGLTIELFKGISLIGGTKYIQGKGTEVITSRDVFGTITSYSPYLINTDQFLLSGGLRLELFKNSFASIEYNKFSLKDHDHSGMNYSLNNFFINFTLRY